jgi:hypothetical protein
MSEIVYRIIALLKSLLRSVPLGTNLGLLHLLFALLSGRFLQSRGAVFAALADLGLADDAVRRASAALTYGRFDLADLLKDWNKTVREEGSFRPHCHGGICPVPVDMVGFFRPKLVGCATKHYTSQAGKALPSVVFGMVGSVGSVGACRHCLPRLLVEALPTQTREAALQKRTLSLAAQTLVEDEALIVDAGFALSEMLSLEKTRFILRGSKNFTARKNALPAYKGKGRPPQNGVYVRPLSRTYQKKRIKATPPDGTARWKEGRHTIKALLFDDLVLSDAKLGSASFRCVVILDPRYQEALVLVTNLPKSVLARDLWLLYKDRWPIEQMPLAAKQMLGASRSFVFASQSRMRLPQLALLAGNVLSYVAATSAPVATGFWDRACRPTCGRLRRLLSRLHFSDLPLREGQVREKASVTAHLPKGVRAHRRQKALTEPLTAQWAARF